MNEVPKKNIAQPQTLSTTDCMAFYYETDQTRQSYETTRQTMKMQDADILAPYHKIQEEKKMARPEKDEISYSEHQSSVPLQTLLHHTNFRILEASECHKAFENVPLDESVVIEADYKGGWDSATGKTTLSQ